MRKVYAKCGIEQGGAFASGAPSYEADADSATLRLSFITADVGKILEGWGSWDWRFRNTLIWHTAASRFHSKKR